MQIKTWKSVEMKRTIGHLFMQMTKEQAEKWAREMCEKGTGEARMQFYNKFGVGESAENLWNDSIFTYGMEYGILIAVAFIFGELSDPPSQ